MLRRYLDGELGFGDNPCELEALGGIEYCVGFWCFRWCGTCGDSGFKLGTERPRFQLVIDA